MSRPAVVPRALDRLDLNVAPFLNEAAVERALRESRPWDLAMYPEPGVPRLEAAIAARAGVAAEEVLAGNGSDEILDLAMRALVPRGGFLGVVEPTFGMYDHFARASGIGVRRARIREGLPAEALASLRADAYFVPSPNNPTGTLFRPEEVASFLDRVDAPVLLDEAYAEFARQDLRSLARERGNVLVTRTFSKAYGLPGIRVGYALGPRDLVARLREIRMPYNLTSWSERAALEALADPGFVDRTVAYVERERDRLSASLREGGWPVWPSHASFLFVGPLPDGTRVRDGLRARGIVVKPVPWPGGDEGTSLRISVGTEEQNARLLDALREVVPSRR